MAFDFSIFRTGHVQTPRELRWAGLLLVVLGLVLVAGGTVFAWLLLDLPIPATWLPKGTRIERAPGDGLSDLQRIALGAITFLTLLCGVAAILQGVWQIVLGRQNKTLLRVIVAVAVVFVAAGVVASIITGCPLGRICK